VKTFCESCGVKLSQTAKFCSGCGESVTSSGTGSYTPEASSKKSTPFDVRCAILAEVWIELRDSVELEDFMREGEIGLALAYAIENEIVAVSDKARELIDPLFESLLESLGVEEDEGWEDLNDLRREDLFGILDSPEDDD
jgi:zinc-ribbon domain